MINLYVNQHQYLIFIGFAVNVSIETFTLLIFLNFFLSVATICPRNQWLAVNFMHSLQRFLIIPPPPPDAGVSPPIRSRVNELLTKILRFFLRIFDSFIYLILYLNV